MSQFETHFTLAQALAALPSLRENLARIHELLGEIEEAQSRVGEKLHVMRGNGHGPIVGGAGPQIEEVRKRIEEIVATGVQIKDLKRGLIDFPHFLGDDPGREVFLCYELGEETISFWHTIEAGFAGREPIQE